MAAAEEIMATTVTPMHVEIEKSESGLIIEKKSLLHPKDKSTAGEAFLIFCGISVAAIVGAYIRVGISYYRFRHTETNYCVMYTQLLGCFIMGACVKQKERMCGQSSNRFNRILYIAITTGLCGSITTFSTWQLECNKSFFLQWDVSWGNMIGSYNGGRFIEWIVCMWSGVAVPISALHLGFAASMWLEAYLKVPMRNGRNVENAAMSTEGTRQTEEGCADCSYVGVLIISLLLIFVCTIDLHPEWIHLTYTAVFGIVGAYSRYLLSNLNSSANFKVGTFVCNVAGTWLAAAFLTIAKCGVDYYNVDAHAVLYGTVYGFCGCLTTVSSLVNELYVMSDEAAYSYGITTHLSAQLGIVLILNVYSFQTVPQSSVMPDPVDICHAAGYLCDNLLLTTGCPAGLALNIPCTNMHDYGTYEGICQCGAFSGDRITELIVDSQVKSNISSGATTVWPRDVDQCDEPTEVFDMCMTYVNACDHYLNRIECPASLRTNRGCEKRGIHHFDYACSCGGNDASDRISELIVDFALFRRYDTLPYSGYATLVSVDFSTGYEDLCDRMLEHIQCPAKSKCSRGNAMKHNYSTWMGSCLCSERETCDSQPDGDDKDSIPHYFPVDFSTRIAEDLYDSIMKPIVLSLLVQPNKSESVWDMCASYFNNYQYFLDKIECPGELREVQACEGVDASHPFGRIENITAICACGAMDSLDERQFEAVIDALTFEVLNRKYLYIPPPTAPYTLAIGSSPFRQLNQPQYNTLPFV